MRIAQSTKVALGALTWLPTVFAGALAAYLWAHHRESTGRAADLLAFAQAMMWFSLASLVSGAVQLGLLIFYLIHLADTRRVRTKYKAFWGIALFFGPLGMPLYFHLVVWPTRAQFMSRLSHKQTPHRFAAITRTAPSQ